MELKTFRGGIHPPYGKELSEHKSISPAPIPEEVIIPLSQHVGVPCKAVVSVGDRVEAGQKLGEAEAFISAPVHSSVSGKVKEIRKVKNFAGAEVDSIIIECDSEQAEFKADRRDISSLSADDIRKIAKEAGIVGLGGAAFPTHVKLSPPEGKKIDAVVINGCECEPYLTCDHRLMLEMPKELIEGAKLMKTAVGASKIYIGIEENKMDAVDELKSAAKDEADVEVVLLEVKYPEGAEKMLIDAILTRRVPPGKLPSEVGVLVQNVQTAVALYEAAAMGKPCYERVITITGPGIKEPKNLLVKVGTQLKHLIDACGGTIGDVRKIIMGGPMTGWPQPDLEAPVVKGSSGVLALTAEVLELSEEEECVGCGKCVDACPMFLMPNYIVKSVNRRDWEDSDRWGARDCFECGCCAYVCPARIDHVKYVRTAKREIAALKK